MILTTVRVERPEGTVIARGLPVQIQEASLEERLGADALGGARPYDLVDIYTTATSATTVRRRDVLYDEVNSDPETGSLAKYRVVNAVENFTVSGLLDHQEIVAERVVGG